MQLLHTLITDLISPLTYARYRTLVADLASLNQTTGEEQSEIRIEYTKLNLQRMKRVEKQFALNPILLQALQQPRPEWHWVVLVESWCGDGAQQLPALAAIADTIPSIELTVLLRDENPDWMDTCLTNGTRSIPKLICLDAETNERLFTWGPRPAAIQEQVVQYKAAHPEATAEEVGTQVHTLYARDKSQALQQDLLELVLRAIPASRDEAK
ncbi:hypothetical protein OB13_17180 [Pontibacter sp. HJ8]